jgi:hypothetical protein
MTRVALALALGALVAAGAFVYRRDRALDERLDRLSEEVRALRERPLPLPLTMPAGTRSVDSEAIAGRVAELLRQKLPAPTPAAAPSSDEPAAAPAPTAAQLATLASAHARVDAAIARGRITRDDVLALRAQLATVDPAERQELRRQIALAVNQQRLVPEDPHFMMP